jgi:C4-dicarboxylate transporter DctQ subunit
MKTAFYRLAAGADLLSAFGLAALMLLMCSSILLRYLFNSPIPDTFNLSRLTLGIAVLWSVAAACARDDHIRNDLFHSALRPPIKTFIDSFAQLCVLVFAVVLAWRLWDKTWDVARTHQETSELRWPIWPFYAAAWTATIAMIAGTFAQLIFAATGKTPQPEGESVTDDDANRERLL